METTHVVITPKTTHFIGQQTNEILEQASLEDMVELDDGSKIKVSAIMEVLPLEEYYNNFPDERPEPRVWIQGREYDWQDIKQLEGLGEEGILSLAARNKKNMEAFARGIQKAIKTMESQGKNPKEAYKLLKKAQAKL